MSEEKNTLIDLPDYDELLKIMKEQDKHFKAIFEYLNGMEKTEESSFEIPSQ